MSGSIVTRARGLLSAGRSGAQPRTAENTGPPARRLRVEHAALATIMVVSAALEFYKLDRNGYANEYYSAAVLSMLHSLHNFFFVSADPGGLISVDKPPIALWLQATSAKIFGFHPLSLLLPEALCGFVSVPICYRIVAPRFGRWPAVWAAAVLATFPAFVASTRDNNLDALLILLMLLGCWAMLRAIETDRLRWLLITAVIVGLAFNTKALAACLVLPGMAVGYLVCASGTWRRRIARLVAAGAVFAAVSLVWIATVDAVPASQRPYVGGTTDDSEFSLTLGYNGFGRVTGEYGAPGHASFTAHAYPKQGATGQTQSNTPPPAPAKVNLKPHRSPQAVTASQAGALRLFVAGYGDQGGWLLLLAAVSLVGLAILLRGTERRASPRLALLFVLGGWLATEVVVLSFSSGIVHPYYLSALGPETAIIVGAGTAAFVSLARRDRRFLALPTVALLLTLATELELLHHNYNYLKWLWPILALVVLGCCVVLWLRPRQTVAALTVGLATMLVMPTIYSASVWEVPVDGTFPAAGPYTDVGEGGIGVTPVDRAIYTKLLSYLDVHAPTEHWAVLTQAAVTAAPMILLGGRAAPLGGYSTRIPVLTPRGLAKLVAGGRARYVLLGGPYSSRGGNAASRAVALECRVVPAHLWRPPVIEGTKTHPIKVYPYGGLNYQLFDCAGRAAALASA